MAAVAFDSLDYAQQLEAVGMPREQALVVAKGLTAMFIHNFDSLVTKDYLDTRFSAVDAAVHSRFADFRLEMHREFEVIHSEVGDLRSTLKLHSWMLALLMGGIFIPLVQQVIS
jgi:hypothetical protein